MNEQGFTIEPRSVMTMRSRSKMKTPSNIWNVSALLPPKIMISLSVTW